MIEIIHVGNSNYLEEVRRLFREYADLIGIDLSFQNFDAELANLPAGYLPPDGALLLALNDNQAAGCVALRQFEAETCEMKRLYVRPHFRSLNIGGKLAQEIINEAKKFGYKQMVLDTLSSSMSKAQSLYVSLGFKEIPAYRYNPEADAVFMQLDL